MILNLSLNSIGRINGGAKGPGLFWVLPCTDSIQVIDLRTVTFDVPPQEILTKDSVTVAVDAVCYFRTFNPVIAVTQAENATVSTRQLAATTLRNILGMRTLQEILQEKEEIATDMQKHLDGVTHSWYVIFNLVSCGFFIKYLCTKFFIIKRSNQIFPVIQINCVLPNIGYFGNIWLYLVFISKRSNFQILLMFG